MSFRSISRQLYFSPGIYHTPWISYIGSISFKLKYASIVFMILNFWLYSRESLPELPAKQVGDTLLIKTFNSPIKLLAYLTCVTNGTLNTEKAIFTSYFQTLNSNFTIYPHVSIEGPKGCSKAFLCFLIYLIFQSKSDCLFLAAGYKALKFVAATSIILLNIMRHALLRRKKDLLPD